MKEVFDIYIRKTNLYYTLYIIAILGFLPLILSKIFTPQFLSQFNTCSIVLFIIGFLSVITILFFSSTNFVNLYVKNGEITISEDSIRISADIILLENIEKIEIDAKDYKGARASDGSGNVIEIYEQNKTKSRYRFVIKSRTQRDNLQDILNKWVKNGIVVRPIGF